MSEAIRVLGVDACPGGWVGVCLDGAVLQVSFAPRIGELAAAVGPVAVIAIDIPIGLPDAGVRDADRLARRELGARSSTLFTTPVRAALAKPDYAAANATTRRITGAGLSKQAYNLREKILDVDEFRTTTAVPLLEVHPELSFREMTGHGQPRKTSCAGAQARQAALAAEGIALRGPLGPAGMRAGVDDVLDAGAVAWTARRFSQGLAHSYPEVPQTFSDGWPTAIWA